MASCASRFYRLMPRRPVILPETLQTVKEAVSDDKETLGHLAVTITSVEGVRLDLRADAAKGEATV
jgi:hypothetical protein